MHELKSQPPDTSSSFVTFTYDNEHLPANYSLHLPDYTNLIKRIRHFHGSGLRFFGCGEYGEKFGRPHYHIIFFNYRPDDCTLHLRGQDHNLYNSASLTEIWGKGDVKIGDVTFDSCAYVARYCTKKITGPKADSHYSILLPDGSRVNRTPEFATQSRRPGLAFNYYQQYKSEIIAHDNIIMNGVAVTPPRYYDKLLDQSDANMRHKLQKSRLEIIKEKRLKKLYRALRADTDRDTPRRAWSKEMYIRAKLKQKTRIL